MTQESTPRTEFRANSLSERKRAEERLEKEQALRGILLDNLPCTAMILKKGTREIVFSNKTARELGAVPGKTCYETCAQRDESCVFCLAPEIWKTNESRQLEVEYNGTHYKGIWVPFTEDLYVHYIFDITERKLAEIELAKQEENLQAIFDSAPVGMLLIDENTAVARINDVGAKLVGKSPAEMLNIQPGEAFCCVYAGDSPQGCGHGPHCSACPIRNTFEQTLSSGQAVHGVECQPTLLIGQEKARPWLEVSAEPLVLNEKKHALVTISNITERKQSEEALKQAKEAAEAANVAKSNFLANMSHEFRTPLNSILGFGELLQLEELSVEQKEWVDTITKSGKNLLALIEDILDFSKIEAGKLSTEIIACSLVEILADIDSLLRPQAINKGLGFEILPQGDLPQTIVTDPIRLGQCLINLISNAIKFTENGHVHVKVSMEDHGGRFIRFDIEDTGIGVELDEQEVIFNSFWQADNSASRKYEGAGLGLAITQRLAEMFGGELLVHSELVKGSVFSLIIPTRIEDVCEVASDRSAASLQVGS